MVISSINRSRPCYQDVVSFTLDHQRYDPWRPILIEATDETKSISLIEARSRVQRLIAGLDHHGVKPGDTVCLHMMNSVMFPVFSLAIIGIGARLTASNPSYKVAELEHHLSTSQASFIITQSAHLDTVRCAARSNGLDERRIFLFLDGATNETSHVSTQDLMSFRKKSWIKFDGKTCAETSVATLSTTSGTEGLPKIAARSHLSIVTEAMAVNDTADAAPYLIKRLLTVPFFHAFAAPMVMINALRHGIQTYVMQRFDQTSFLAAISKYGINETAMPPPLVLRFMSVPASERTELRFLKRVMCGGASLPRDIQNHALQMFAPDARIQQCWGMTEMGWIATFAKESDVSGSVGRLITGKAKLVDENGTEVHGQDAVGEIMVSSSTNMMGYLGNHMASQSMFDDEGFMRTGDVGYFSPDGKIYIKGRIKELIKVRGFQVSPHEIENSLLSYCGVIDAAVIGIPFHDGSEVPRAYIVCEPGFCASEQDIKAHLLQTLSRYKVMDCQLRMVDSIPKSATGKILKRVLRQQAEEDADIRV